MPRFTVDTINYYIKTYSVTDQQEYTINNTKNIIDASTPYYISGLSLTNDVFDPLNNTCDIDLIFVPDSAYYTNNSSKIITNAILDGNVIEVFESYYNQLFDTPIFVGYILECNPSEIHSQGFKISLKCSSILSQLSKELVVNSYQDVLTLLGSQEHPITDYVENQIPLGQILSFMTNQSLLSFILKSNIVDSSSQFQGVELPFLVTDYSENGIDVYTPIYYYANTEDDKLTSLMKSIYAYQMIMYQDLNGVVQITQPNAGESFSPWYFEIGLYNKTVSDISMLVTEYDIKFKSADVTNRAFASLLNLGFNTTNENDKTQYNYVANVTGDLFPRVEALYNTGIFTMSKHDVVDIGPGLITNPLLTNILTTIYAKNKNIILTNLSGDKDTNTITGIYANTLLARELFAETQITLTMARGSCVDPTLSIADRVTLLPIPLGKIINVNDYGQFNLPTSSFYVYSVTLSSYEDRGTLLTLRLCKPYTYTAFWGNVPIS